jgi:DNA-binding GntR family transcriptional regulator
MMFIPAEKAARIVDGLATRATEITDRLRDQVAPLIPDVIAKDEDAARAIMQPHFDRAAAQLRELVANSVAHLESTEH